MKFELLVAPEDVLTTEMDNIRGGKSDKDQIVVCSGDGIVKSQVAADDTLSVF
ncbi:hypothetical protein GGR21_000616 [Dysgonomonas hofstadii]|uniref:Uncharacterized protein n=1 Tax=Dysgonomonas hofstadii TaxID=637886 RepID=A0A840CJ81_9BACT|nr:hypothetical protein [Dysgonomonas hofstadii]MBB4034729.1 hypothetical protein [Dysgonomonas hofstadii]